MSLKARASRDLKNRAHLRQTDAAWQQLQQEQEEDRKHERWEDTAEEIAALESTYWQEAEPWEETRWSATHD